MLGFAVTSQRNLSGTVQNHVPLREGMDCTSGVGSLVCIDHCDVLAHQRVMVKYSQFLLIFYLLRLSVGNIYNDRVPNGPNDLIKVYGRRLLRPYDRRQIRSLISGSL